MRYYKGASGWPHDIVPIEVKKISTQSVWLLNGRVERKDTEHSFIAETFQEVKEELLRRAQNNINRVLHHLEEANNILATVAAL